MLFPKIALCDFRRDAQSKNLSYAFIRTLSPPRSVIPRPPCSRLFAAVITRAPFARGIGFLLFAFRPFVAQGALTAFVSGPGDFSLCGCPTLAFQRVGFLSRCHSERSVAMCAFRKSCFAIFVATRSRRISPTLSFAHSRHLALSSRDPRALVCLLLSSRGRLLPEGSAFRFCGCPTLRF